MTSYSVVRNDRDPPPDVTVDVESPALRAGLWALLNNAVPSVHAHAASVRIVDEWRMVGIDPSVNVVAVLSSTDIALVCRAAAHGARGLLHRDGPAEELCQAIESVARGGCWVSPIFSDALHAMMSSSVRWQRQRERWATLSARQQEVLRMLIAGRSTAAIATDLQISRGTAKLHVSEILRRFRVSSRAQAVAAALGLDR